ncbi:MAG: hypothetical protein OXG04_17750 [Acidobacteria bacterium]|nr:hypothetical protein [Acidobacteriota bacterium]
MKRLVRSVGIALLMASGDSLAAWTRGVQPPQPPIAVTGASTGAQTATGTPGGQTPAQQPADADAASAAPTRPAGTEAANALDPAPFVGPPEPPWLYGPPEPPWLYGPPAPGIEELAEGLYVVTGYGGNVVARITAEGVVVAGELTAAADTIAATIAGVTDQPVRYVLRTHRHDGEPAALPAPWRDARRVAPGQPVPLPLGAAARQRPEATDLTFTRGLSLFLGGAEVRLHHFAPAHTGGDTAVLFPDLGVVYAGNLVVRGMPFIDYAAGGSSRGWVETLDGILALEFETAVPGAGPALTKREVQVFRDRFVTLRMRTMQLLYRGVAREDALPLLETSDLDWPLVAGRPFAERSFAALYDELVVEREEARAAAERARGTAEEEEEEERP